MNNALLPTFDKLRINTFNIFLKIIILSLQLLDSLFKRIDQLHRSGGVAIESAFKEFQFSFYRCFGFLHIYHLIVLAR